MMYNYRYYLLAFCFFLTTTLLAQLDFSQKEAFTDSLLTKLDQQITTGKYERITSVLIAKDGKVIFEKYYNDAEVNTLHNTRSATKTMASLLVGIAIDQGHIQSEEDKIFTHLKHKLPTKNPDNRKENITIKDLLTMSSMLECDDNNYFSRGHEERMYYIEDWSQFFVDLPIRAYPFNPKPEDCPYGRAFRYCSAGTAVLAEVVHSAVPMNADAFAKKYLLEPLGIKTYKLHYTPMNILNTAGGSEYRSRDFLRLIQLCINKGQWKGQQVISSSWIDKATTAHANAYDEVDYGYVFWLHKFGKTKKYKAYYMAGNGGNKILGFPTLALSVVLTTKNYNNRNAHNYTDEVLNEYIIPAVVKSVEEGK